MMGVRVSWCRFECSRAESRNLPRVKNGAAHMDRPDVTAESEGRF